MKQQFLNTNLENVKHLSPLLGIYFAKRMQESLIKTKPSSVKERVLKKEIQSLIAEVLFK